MSEPTLESIGKIMKKHIILANQFIGGYEQTLSFCPHDLTYRITFEDVNSSTRVAFKHPQDALTRYNAGPEGGF